jgi:DNA-binding Xre family transcriptional regulator
MKNLVSDLDELCKLLVCRPGDLRAKSLELLQD